MGWDVHPRRCPDQVQPSVDLFLQWLAEIVALNAVKPDSSI
jgi:hypothetical protein